MILTIFRDVPGFAMAKWMTEGEGEVARRAKHRVRWRGMKNRQKCLSHLLRIPGAERFEDCRVIKICVIFAEGMSELVF